MKYIKAIAVAAVLAGAAFSSRANLVLDFQSNQGVFVGGGGNSFTLVNLSGQTPYFTITSASGSSATGDAVGDTGAFSLGGPIVITSIDAGGTQGTVNSGNSLRLSDAAANPPAVDTAHTVYTVVNWSTISLSGGVVTLSGAVGLNPNYFNTVGDYTGTQVDMQTLANAMEAIMTISFQTTYGNLYDLENGSGSGGAFTGQIFVSTSKTPEPTTLISGALLLLPIGLSALRAVCKK